MLHVALRPTTGLICRQILYSTLNNEILETFVKCYTSFVWMKFSLVLNILTIHKGKTNEDSG